MASIPLDKEKGLDPHLTHCPRCGGPGSGLTIGAIRKAKLPNGQYAYGNVGKLTQAGKSLMDQGAIRSKYDLHWEKLEDNETVPDTEPCAKCQEDMQMQSDEIARGGVFFKCKECGTQGIVVYSDSTKAMCDEIRKQVGVEFGQPCGVELNACEEHGEVRDE